MHHPAPVLELERGKRCAIAYPWSSPRLSDLEHQRVERARHQLDRRARASDG